MATHTNPTQPTTLILGARGTVGSALNPLLTALGHRTRLATSRPPQAADEVHLNLLTGEGVSAAFDDVDQAFLMAPPGHINQDVLLAPVVDAARAHGLKRVVLMSAMGADADERSPLRLVEKHLQASGLAWNVIRPNWFMQNFNSYWIQGIREQGQIFLPTGQGRGSFIDARDIASVAATLLTTDAHANAEFDLTGAEALDHDQVAAILSQATGRTIGYTEVTPEAMRPGLLAAGLSPDYADFLLLLLSYFKAGYAERTTDAVQRITGRTPIGFEQYARDHRQAWA